MRRDHGVKLADDRGEDAGLDAGATAWHSHTVS